MIQKILKNEIKTAGGMGRDYCGGGCYSTSRLHKSFANREKEVPALIEKQKKDGTDKTKDSKKKMAKEVPKGPTNMSDAEWRNERW